MIVVIIKLTFAVLKYVFDLLATKFSFVVSFSNHEWNTLRQAQGERKKS